MCMETLTINGRGILVKKLPLRKYPEILTVLQRMQQKSNITESDTDQLLERLPELITTNFDDVVALVGIALDVPADDVKEWGIDDLVTVITKFFEVNRFGLVYEQIKKVIARPPAPVAE